MRPPRRLRRLAGTLSAVLLLGCAMLVLAGQPGVAASSHAQINGSGSSWAENALNQWIADVQSNGLRVVFTANGSAQGRQDYANRTTDFAVSDIGYQGQDSETGQNDTSLGRSYAYLPMVAGGTSFPYHIVVGGKSYRDLRLSGQTLAKIFTNQITNWDDPEITKDNNGHALPSIPIVPVVHSEGSGSTAQFTTYLNAQYPSIWRPYYGRSGFTEYYPRKGSEVAQNGSDGVMNYIGSKAANGAIGYDEYSYPLAAGYPVAKVENSAGYFTAPDQYNVAVALTQAKINYSKNDPSCPTGPANCYLLQDLSKVYTYKDPRTYPLSSYSYMIIPTGSTDPTMTTQKRQTLADFVYYSICQGQAEMGPIGYSPLPINLVQASFAQTSLLHKADSGVQLNNENVKTCHNPTFVAGHPTENYLAKIAPQPPACDKANAGPCSGTTGISTGNPTAGKAPASTSSGTAGGTTGGTSGGGSSAAAGGTTAAGQTGSGAIDPITGQASSGGTATDANAVGTPTVLAASTSGALGRLLALLVGVAVLVLLVVPPFVYDGLNRRRPRGGAAP